MKVTTDSCLFGAWAAEEIKNSPRTTNNCLDIGTGTGLLSLMLAQKITTLKIDAVEIEPGAFEQATENVAASPWPKSVTLINADIKKLALQQQYDTIISNPPFYEKELKGEDAKKNAAHHDASLLLPDLLTIISKQLCSGGNFFLLLPFKREAEIKGLLAKTNLTAEQIVYVKQTPSHHPFRILIKGIKLIDLQINIKVVDIIIKDEKGNYTPDFFSLLKDYYLHL